MLWSLSSYQLEGLWLNKKYEIMYAVATRITFICPMTFTSFPLDVQICKFQVGSFNYAIDKMIFRWVIKCLINRIMLNYGMWFYMLFKSFEMIWFLIYFRDEFISESDQIRSVLDYYINITALAKRDQYYVALTGKQKCNSKCYKTKLTQKWNEVFYTINQWIFFSYE